jgi:putative RNA 2'-phosphotransferase
MNNRIYESSRLAHLLRHSSLPNHNGWVEINVLIKNNKFTAQELESLVFEDDKGRFEFSGDGLSVRALYGHSIDVDLGLKPTTPPSVLYHGSATKYIESIMEEGLKPRKRNYVHLSENVQTASSVGARHGTPIVLSIDTISMLQDGCLFYKAQNGVWLTLNVDKKYIKNSGL